jgi:hypothetical protein
LPYLRLLDVGFPTQRPEFDPGEDLLWTKWHWGSDLFSLNVPGLGEKVNNENVSQWAQGSESSHIRSSKANNCTPALGYLALLEQNAEQKKHIHLIPLVQIVALAIDVAAAE